MSSDETQWDPATSAAALSALMQLVSGYAYSWAVCVAARLRLADILAAGPLPARRVADRCGADPDALERLLVTLVALGLFTRRSDGQFAATPMSHWLRSDVAGTQRPLALLGGERCLWEAWEGLYQAVRRGGAAFESVHGLPFFDYLDQQPALLRTFQDAGRGTPEWNAAMADAFDFSDCRRVIDVGGGDGSLMRAILDRYPHLEGVVYERPAVIEAVGRDSEADPPWRWVAGDFLDQVPEGGDVYILRRILHDWDDDRAGRILACCRRAISAAGRLLVLEYFLQPGYGSSTALLDLTLLVLTGGRERTEAEYRRLLSDGGFEVERIGATAVGIRLVVARPV